VVYVFIHWFGMFPLISGAAAKQPHAWLYFLVPIFVLGTASGTLAELIRHLREELSRVLAEDYIRTARAKGAPVLRHRVQGRLPDSGHRDHEREDPVPARGRGHRRAGVQLAGHGAHGVAGRAGPRLPGDHGIALVAAASCVTGNLLQRVVFTMVKPARVRSNREQRVRRYVQTAGPIGEFYGAAAAAARRDPGPGCTPATAC